MSNSTISPPINPSETSFTNAETAAVNFRVETPITGLAPNIQTLFAHLQMTQAQTCKRVAAQKMEEVKAAQREQQEMGRALVTLQSCVGKDAGEDILKDVRPLLNANGVNLNYSERMIRVRTSQIRIGRFITHWKWSAQKYYRPQDTEINIKKISSVQEQINAKMQTIMVSLQDFMGQYNSYLDGSRAAMNKANAVMSKLATTKE